MRHLLIVMHICAAASLVYASSLHQAFITGNVDLVKTLLAIPEIDVNEYNQDGFTPLSLLIRSPLDEPAEEQIAEALLKHRKINPNLGSKNGETALFMAASHANDRMVKRLLTFETLRVNLKTTNNNFCTPLQAAIKSADTQDAVTRARALRTVKLLLQDKRVNVNIDCGEKIPFLEGIKYLDDEGIRLLLQKGLFNVNTQSRDGKGILHVALQSVHLNNAFAILRSDYNLNRNMADKDGNTVLHLACMHLDDPKVLQLFRTEFTCTQYSWNIHNFNGDTPLHLFIKWMHANNGSVKDQLIDFYGVLKDFIYSFRAYNTEDENGDTCFHLLLKLFIERLDAGAGKDEQEALTSLLQILNGAEFDVNHQNKQGQTVFHLLASLPALQSRDILGGFLLKPDFDPYLLDTNGHSASQVALNHGNEQFVYTLWNIAYPEHYFMRLLDSPLAVYPEETLKRKHSSEGLLNRALSNQWISAVNILITNEKFGYCSEDVYKDYPDFLHATLCIKNDDLTRNMWALYKNHLKVDAKDPLFRDLLKSGLEDIYDDLEGKSECYEGNEKIQYAARYGWIEFLRRNKHLLGRNAKNARGVTLLHLALEQSDPHKRNLVIDFLLEDPEMIINIDDLLEEKSIELTSLIPAQNAKLTEMTIEYFLKKATDLESNNESLQNDLEDLLCQSYQFATVETFQKVQHLLYERLGLSKRSSTKRINAFRNAVISQVDRNDAIRILIDRNNILETTRTEIRRIQAAGMDFKKRRLQITYHEEGGADAGALLIDYFYNISQALFTKTTLFQMIGEETQYVNVSPCDDRITKDLLEEYRFAGSIFALAILNQGVLSEPISKALLGRLLGEPERMTDIIEIDYGQYTMFKTKYLDLSEEEFAKTGLTFKHLFYHEKSKALVPFKDREQVIERVICDQLYGKRRHQMEALREGFLGVISPERLQILQPADLQDLLAGDKDVDLLDWKDNTVYDGIYAAQKENHPTIRMFWKIVEENSRLRMKIIKFSTGFGRLPKGGFKGLGKQLKIDWKEEAVGDTLKLPTASSCRFILKIPPYKDEDVFKKKLTFAVEETAGFEQT